MKTFCLFSALAAAVLASPASIVPDIASPDAIILSRQELHDNVLKNHPSEWIMNSTDVDDYLLANRDANHTIYISDERAFVSLANVEYDVKTLVSRESGPCIAPARYTKTYTKQTQQWSGAWGTASSCLYTGKSNMGGSQAITTSYSIAIQENAGLSFTIIKDVLSATLGLTVTETYTSTITHTCNVAAHSVVQVWARPYIAWGWFWSQNCVSNSMCGGCGPEYVNGGATAPAINPNTGQWLNYGCSTGTKNVKC